MSSRLSKIVVIIMLLVLVIGPALQIFDFMDGCIQDGDGLLHAVDACLCIAFALLAGLVLVYFVSLSSWFHDLHEPEQKRERSQRCNVSPSFHVSFGTPPLALRI